MPDAQSPFRFDVVGSFLRPQYLLAAREQHQNGVITAAELKVVEDKAIIELIAKEEKAGLKAVTDGEFRRTSWHCDFFWGLNGVEEKIMETAGTAFAGEKSYDISAELAGKISGENHPFIEHFKFTRAHASANVAVTQTIPAPARFIQEMLRDFNLAATQAVYDSLEELVADTARAYTQVMADLYAAGCRTVQFDDTSWARIIDGKDINGHEYSDEEKEQLKELYVTVNNQAIAGKPDGLRVNTHICRGNFRSTWFASGGYESVATPVFDQENVCAYYLEYDSDRSGGFAPLAKVSAGKKVVLGLVTSKDGKLEDKQELKNRIKEASQYVPLENLYISPQCGFSSNAVGNLITDEDQWNKIALLQEVAKEVWGD